MSDLMMPDAMPANPTVVLLHGLARSPASMAKLERALRGAGFSTCNIAYPSTRHTIEELAARFVLPRIRACVADGAPVSFVTHSLGGIIPRLIHESEPGMVFGRVVMLGPPNQGSELADRMRHWPLYRWINGPAGQQLGTGAESVPRQLGPARFELGVIAGNKPFLEPFRHYIHGPSDGKVSLQSARLQGMKDFLVLPVTHALMMRDRRVIEQTIQFLRHGAFGVGDGDAT